MINVATFTMTLLYLQVEQSRRVTGRAADLASRGHKQISSQAEFKAHVEHLFTLAPGEDPKPPQLTNSQVGAFTLFGFLTILQILGIFMGIYASTNGPLFGMCFPAECTADNINGMSRQTKTLLHSICR